MEAISNGYSTAKSFVSSIIEWRSAATAPYFMLINSAFWWGVFYLDREIQMRLLMSLAAGVFGWDILLSSTHERSILFHTLMWPLRNVLRTVSVLMALYSAQCLHRMERERACWSAYTTVALLMLNPVWQYQQIPQKINGCLYAVFITTKNITQRIFISPLCSLFRVLKYIIMLRWLSAVLEKVKSMLLKLITFIITSYTKVVANLRCGRDLMLNTVTSILHSIKTSILHLVHGIKSAVVEFFCTVKNCITGLFIFCKNIIVNCVIGIKNGIISTVRSFRNAVVYLFTSTTDGIISIIMAFKGGIFCGLVALKNGILSALRTIKNGIVLGMIASKDTLCYIIISSKTYIYNGLISMRIILSNCFRAIRSWFRRKILEPIRSAYHKTVEFLRYWLCAYWWPSLKSWLILHVGQQLQRLFNYICFVLVYIFCGYWLDPVGAYLSLYLKRFYAFIKRKVLIPLKIWAIRLFHEALKRIKLMLHNLAIAIRDSVLWPFCLLLVALMKKVLSHFYRIALQPIINALYQKYKIVEDYVLIHFLGPACQVFIDHIPERSPFCDDTDTELADFLPPGFDEDEESENEGIIDKPSSPSRSLSPLTEDERDFVRGLQFPTVNTSDSSEDEFSLKPKSARIRKHAIKKQEKVHPKDPTPSFPDDDKMNYRAGTGKDKNKQSSSISSHSESTTTSSSALLNDIDLKDMDVLDLELADLQKQETSEQEKQSVQKSKETDASGSGKRNGSREEIIAEKNEEGIDIQSTDQAGSIISTAAITAGLDSSFELLDK